ncbi:hypothetical protein SEVIR_4G295600v4 [Setaria viridis]|uniref:Uncharacterized protein n=1 Tax=Setaria viridis TaxID=4556 RepID=A0A4U6V5M7_SETVI|nr:DDB1- and CUL4-associated factor 8 [Setaria viridis]TKW23495.1 hypothetical protein SEVIR_4G295600v2 [Setaria viridis]
MPPDRKRMAGLWEREVGGLPPRHFANAVMASKDFVQSLSIQKRLRKHRGCVNTISFNSDGRFLLSGADDRNVVLWNWVEAAPTFSFHSGHSNNVLHAQFMPFSDDRSVVTCAADGEVRHSQIREGGCATTDKLVELDFAVHRLAVEPGSPYTFYCCCEDSSVWLFDLRGKDAVELFRCRTADHFTADDIELFAIAIDPRKPCCFAVAGSDEYVRIYDTRKIGLDGNSNSGLATEHFCPPHLIGENKDGITGLAYSQTSELLASYSHDNIYLFSREHGLHFNNIEVDERLLMDETGPLPFCRDKLPIPKAFKGHTNQHTIKGVNFLGPNCDYVTSGSDCGRIFIWRKKDGELIRVMNGDRHIVNCVEQHPSGIVVASSGIDNDIKIWEPGEGETHSIATDDKVKEDMWLSTSSDSDGLIYNGDFDYVMDLDDIYLYGNADGHSSNEDEDGSSEEDDDGDISAEEDDDGDDSAEEGVDGENSAGDMSDG